MEEIFYHNFIRVRVRQHTRTAPRTNGTAYERHHTRTAPHTDGTTHGRRCTRTAPRTNGTAYEQHHTRTAPRTGGAVRGRHRIRTFFWEANAPHITRMYTIDEPMDVGPVAHT